MRGLPVAVNWPPNQTQKDRCQVGSLPHNSTPQEQSQNASKSQVKDAMEPAVVEEVLVQYRENISPRYSGLNRKETSREMDSPHQDLLPVKKLYSSTVSIAHNREETFEEVAMKSPEVCINIRATSDQI